MSVAKLDLRKTLKPFYSPRGAVELVKIPPMKVIMVDGKGDPASKTFQEAVGILYGLTYTLKFQCKRLLKRDFSVIALEGLWWMKGAGFDLTKRNEWLWTMMIVQPDFVTDRMFSEAANELRLRRNPAGLERARLESFDEGYCIQIMHVGPYSAEAESIARLGAYANEHGYVMTGKHHEIYLGDPRRSAPSKLRTVIRHPVSGIRESL